MTPPPPPTVYIGGANGTTITSVKLNGVTTTVATVAPGATVDVGATLTLGPGVDPGWYCNAPIAFAGQPFPSGLGCLGGAGVGYTETGTFALTAPTTAGVYNGQHPACVQQPGGRTDGQGAHRGRGGDAEAARVVPLRRPAAAWGPSATAGGPRRVLGDAVGPGSFEA